MIFTPSDELPPDPTVRIFFTGLLIVKPLADKTSQVFVHNSSSLHNLLIEVRRKHPGKPDVIMMRIPGPLASTGGPPHNSHGLLIRTAGLQPSEKAVQAYNGEVISTEGTKLADSFTLSELLAVPPGEVDPVRGRPSILIDHGIFYTAAIKDCDAELIKKDGSLLRALTEVPTIIGANIYLNQQDQNQKVNLKWRQHGADVSLDLTPSPDFTYEIYINNEPLFEEDSPTTPVHDEFEEYFRILPAVPENEQFKIVFPPEPIPDRGSSRTPCMSVVLTD